MVNSRPVFVSVRSQLVYEHPSLLAGHTWYSGRNASMICFASGIRVEPGEAGIEGHCRGKLLSPEQRRRAVDHAQQQGMSERWAATPAGARTTRLELRLRQRQDTRWTLRAHAEPNRRAHAGMSDDPLRTELVERQGDRRAGGCNGREGSSGASSIG